MVDKYVFDQKLALNKLSRSSIKNQTPKVFWFTGLSGSGKSTIANALELKLYSKGCHTYLLDGDNVRSGLCKDLDFSDAGRIENLRRVAEVAKLMVDAGLIVIVAFISPFRRERQWARKLFDKNEFIEVFIDAPLEVAEKRDVKGLYQMARKGMLQNFTGIDSPYEEPLNAEVVVRTDRMSVNECVNTIIKLDK